MPAPQCTRATKTAIVNQRSMAVGDASLHEEPFSAHKTTMGFGDARRVVEDTAKAVE